MSSTAQYYKPSRAVLASAQALPFGPIAVASGATGTYLPLWALDSAVPAGFGSVILSSTVVRIAAGVDGQDIGRLQVYFSLGFENLGSNAAFEVHAEAGVRLNDASPVVLASVDISAGVTNQNDHGRFTALRQLVITLATLQSFSATSLDLAIRMTQDSGASKDVQITEVYAVVEQLTHPSLL